MANRVLLYFKLYESSSVLVGKHGLISRKPLHLRSPPGVSFGTALQPEPGRFGRRLRTTAASVPADVFSVFVPVASVLRSLRSATRGI